MYSETGYTMLMTSLPHLGTLFEAKYSVISRIKLERRLNMLMPEDAETISLIESVLWWSSFGETKDDASFLEYARRVLAQMTDPVLYSIVRHRIELRTLVAALRRRHQGRPAPLEGEKWGAGRWVKVIERNWHEPGFGVQRAFPWVLEAQRLLDEKNTVALERLLLEEVWKELGRKSQGHDFDFIAVVIYVLRWDVMERWTHYQDEVALERFSGLIDAAIGDHMPLHGREAAHG